VKVGTAEEFAMIYLIGLAVEACGLKGVSPHRFQVRDLLGANSPLESHPLV
jgi:hypothetical protein